MASIKKAIDVTKLGLKNAAIGTVKSSVKNVKKVDGVESKRMGNMWTGKKINPLHLGVAGGLYLGAQSMGESINFKTKAGLDMAIANDYQNYGAPDVMSYDGVSQQRAPQNLNANGSLVFGLHNNRKG